ncbi:hypothetical protein Tco_0189216 [Tanacetum coccineum]
MTLNFDDTPWSFQSPIRPTQEEEPEEQFKDDEFLADIPLNISRPRGLSIPGPMQSQPQQPLKLLTQKKKASPTSLAHEVLNDDFLKGQGYKNLPKIKVSTNERNKYDKVQESIKDSFKDLSKVGSEKDKQCTGERCKETLRKRKLQFTDRTQPIKEA